MGAADRIFQRAMLHHQSDRMFEIGIAGFALFERAAPELPFGIALPPTLLATADDVIE